MSTPDPFIELTTELARLRVATYQGWDPARLAVATVDGDGTIVRVRFPRPVARYHPVAVGEAIQVAVANAQQRAVEAVAALTARAEALARDVEAEVADGA
jgi:hypothetical protein